MVKEKSTMIKVFPSTRLRLRKLRLTLRESYDEIINRLIQKEVKG
jgi:hypothetical protein